MARLEIEPRAATLIKRLKKLEGAVENPAPILSEIGDVLRKSTVSRFYSQTSPTGRRWKPSKAAKRKRRLTLVRTGDLRDSIRVAMSAGRVEVGTDIWYARIHQQGGPIDAQYKRKSGRTATPRLPRLGSLTPNASSALKLAQSALRRRRIRGRHKARNVRLPARRFLGVSKRDRKRTTQILMDKLSEALAMTQEAGRIVRLLAASVSGMADRRFNRTTWFKAVSPQVLRAESSFRMDRPKTG